MKTSWLKAAPLLALNVFILWPPYILLCAVLWLAGLPLVSLAALGRQWEHMPSRVWPERIVRRWWHVGKWMNVIYGNEQDGIDGLPVNHLSSNPNWADRKFVDLVARVINWSAIRNPTNNLRFMHHFAPRLGWLNPNTIEPKRIKWCGREAPLDAALEKWMSPHMASAGDDSVMVAPGGFMRRFACLFVSQGLYAGLRIAVRFRGRAHQIWFGWKLNPGMADPAWWPEDPCWKGVGFTCGQVRHSA